MASTYQESVEQTITAGEQIHQIVNGTATTEVTVEDGSKVPSIRKALLDNFYFKGPIAWQVGQTENVFNQLRQFTDGSWWYAPSATVSNPVSMGATPVGDSLWKIYDFDAIGKLEPRVLESLRRSYASAGYMLVSGSFEKGGNIASANQVLLYELEGKAYSWAGSLPKIVPAGSSPSSGGGVSSTGWIDRSNSFEFFDVRQYGVIGDGLIDDTLNFQNAIDSIFSIGGGTLYIPQNMTIKCSSLLYGRKGVSLKCEPTSWLDFRGAGWLTPTNNLALFGYYGTAGAFITPTADMVEGSNKIAVPSAAAFNVGDMIELSMDSNGKWDDTSTVVTAGQLAIVIGVFTDTNYITISEPLYETLTLANSARIRIIDPIENVTVDGLGIIGNGRNPAGNAEQGLKIFFGRNNHIKNCRLKDVDTQSIGMISCYGGSIKDNRLDTQPLGAIDVISYGVAYSSSMHIEISGNHSINYRHGAVSSHLARGYGYYGINRFIDIHDNTVTSNYGALNSAGWPRAHGGIATHTDAEFVSIHNNTVVGCRYGVNVRTANNSVKDNKIHDCPIGVLLTEYWADIEITGNEIYNCVIPFSSGDPSNEVPRGVLNVSRNVMDGCGGSAITFPNTIKSKLIFDDNVIRGPKNTGATATLSAYNNVDLFASGNNIEVNDTLAIRAAGTGYQLIKDNKISSLIPYNDNAALYVVSATKFAISGNEVTAPVGSTNGGIAHPTKLLAPSSVLSNNTYIEV